MSSDNIDKMISNFTDFAELQTYANVQYKLTIELSKKIHQLEEENIHLKKLLDKSIPPLEGANKTVEIYQNVDDKEAICLMQIKLLKETSIERELTLEEAKKFDIYTKILVELNKKNAEQPPQEARMSDAELISLMNKLDE